MKDEQRLDGVSRDPSPCKGCEERFPACSGRCPKDLRGEYGYTAWKADIEQVKQAKKAYMDSRQDDGKRRDRWVIKR
jgi:hypothetical protein